MVMRSPFDGGSKKTQGDEGSHDMKLRKWIAGVGIVLVATLGAIGMTQSNADALGPGAVAKTVDPGGGDHGIWP